MAQPTGLNAVMQPLVVRPLCPLKTRVTGNTQKTMENGYFVTAMMKQCSDDVAQEDSMIAQVELLFMESNVVKSWLKNKQMNRRKILSIDRNVNKKISPDRSYVLTEYEIESSFQNKCFVTCILKRCRML